MKVSKQDSPDTFFVTEALDVWGAAVLEYTRGHLTFEKDKLVAISGIAKELYPFLQCRYLAGHWEVNLDRQLGWCCMGAYSRRPSTYRAPSWSWASVDGAIDQAMVVNTPGRVHHSLVTILHVHVNPLSAENPLGQVTGGVLKLRGQLIPFKRCASPQGIFHRIVLVHGKQTKLRMDFDDLLARYMVPSTLFALPVEVVTGSDLEVNGLVLERLEMEGLGFRRVGWIGKRGSSSFGEDLENDPLGRYFGKAWQVPGDEPGRLRWEFKPSEPEKTHVLEIF
jgi:hypothetical protein